MNMTPPFFRTPRSILLTSIALLSPFLIVPANAGVIWDGGGADDNWGTGANWSPDGPPPVGATVDLTFDGTTRLTPFNNYTAFDDFHSLFFAATAGQFNVGGNAIDLFGKIENYSTVTQTVSLASLAINAGQAGTGEFNPVNGDLVINSANVFTNGNALHVYGPNNRTVTFGAGTVISQGGSFAIEQANTVVFQSAHIYTGDTFVNAGTLAFAAGGSVNGSIIRLGSTAADSGAATVSLTAAAGAQTLASTLVVRPSASGTQGTRTIASQNTSGTNTLSGGVFLDADLTTSATAGGTLAFTGSAFDLKNQTLTVGGAGNTTIGGVLQNSTGSGKLTKTGNGTLTLSGANTFTGLVSINGGAVNVGSWNLSGAAGVWGAAANGAAATTFIQMNGGRINYTGAAASGDLRGVNLVSGNNTIDIITGSTLTFGGAFNRFQSNGGNLIKEGGGTLQIGSSGIANNVFTGKVTINAGALDWFGAGSMPSPGALVSDFITINNGAKFQLTYTGAPTTVPANIGFKVSDSAGIEILGNHTIAGAIANGANPGSVTKTGAGNLTLSGANTYTGGTIVNAGLLVFGAGAGSVPATGNVTINASGVLAATGPAGFTTAGLWAGSGRIAAASSGVLALPANDSSNVDFSSTSSLFLGTTGNFTYSGTLTPGSNGFRLGGGGGTLTVSSALTGAAALTSAGAVTLSGANTYTGATNVNGGTLKAGVASVANASGAFGKNSAVNLSNVAGVALDITGFNTQIGSLTGGGATGGNVTLGAATLRLGGDNTSPAAYAGVISGVGGAVTKIGTGTQILTGANTFTGALTVEAGTLSVPVWNNSSTNGPLGNSALPLTLGSATTQGTLRFTGGGSNNVPTTIKLLSLAAGGGKVEMVYVAGNRGSNYIHINGDRITGSGGLTVDTFAGGATSRFIVIGSAPYTGPTVVAAGSEIQTNYLDTVNDGTPFGAGLNGLGSAVTVNSGGLLSFYSNNANTTVALGSLSGSGTAQGEGGGIHTFKIGGDGTSTAFSGIFQNNGGPVAVTKVGTGTLTLSGASTHTGLFAINGGAISVPTWNLSGAAGPWGAVANNTGAPATTFIQMNGGRINYTGPSATGNLRGVNLVSGNNTIDIITGSTLNFAGFNTFQSNGGNLIKEGSGTLQLGTDGIANNVFTGKVTLNAGTLEWFGGESMPSPAALVSDFITINNGATFQLSYVGGSTVNANVGFKVVGNAGFSIPAATHTIPGVISDGASAGGITKSGNGNLALTAANTYSSATTISGGTLTLSGAGAIADTSAVNVSGATAVLNISGITAGGETVGSLAGVSGSSVVLGAKTLTVGGDNTSTVFAGVLSGGGGSLTKIGNGALTLSGANSHNGLVTINGGAISVPSWNLSGVAGPWGTAGNNPGAAATTFIQMNGGRINYTGASASGDLRGVNLVSGNNTIDVITGSTLNFAGGFNRFQSNGGNLIKEGGGTLQLGSNGIANNVFTGKVTINAGALDWFGAGSMPAPVALVPDFITINNGAKFQLTYTGVPTTVPVNIGFNVAGSAGLEVVGNHTIAGVIANGASAGGVTKTGNGTVTLSNANTYTGATAVNDGTLSLTGTLSGTSITVSGASTVFTQAGASVIAGIGSTFTVNGGTATIPGANTFTGAVTVADGTLMTNNWNNDGTDGPLGNSALPVTLGGASTMGTLRYTGGNFLPDNAKKGLSLNAGGGTVQLAMGPNRSSFAHLNGSSITGSGGLTVQTGGARFLIVGSAAYTGPTVVAASSELQANYYDTVNDGTPFGAGTNGLGSPVTVGAGSFLTLYSAGANTTVAIGSLSGTGTVRGEYFGTHTLKTGGDNSSTTFSGVIADSFDNPSSTALTKVGTGTQTLSGVNTYTGATLVTAGTLLVSGSISGSTVTVDGGTLGGSGGTVGATTVNNGGTFAPGASIGTLNVSGTLALGGTAAFELNKSGFTLSADLANVTGALTLGGTLNVTATGDTLTPGDSFNLFDAASFAGSFATLNLPSLTFDYTWDTSALSADGSIVVVPEPGAIISLLSGLGILAAFRRRRA